MKYMISFDDESVLLANEQGIKEYALMVKTNNPTCPDSLNPSVFADAVMIIIWSGEFVEMIPDADYYTMIAENSGKHFGKSRDELIEIGKKIESGELED